MKRMLALLLSFLIVLSFAGCSKPVPKEPVLIGLTDAFSGDRSGNGQFAREGAEMFLEDINGKGGVQGREVQIVYEDDQGSEVAAVSAYQKLVQENDKLCGVVTNRYSGVILAMEPYIAEAKLPTICSASTVKIENSKNEYLYSTRRSDYGTGLTMAAFIKQQGAKRIAILSAPDALGKGIGERVSSRLKETGIEVVFQKQYEKGETEFAGYAAEIKEANPDFIVCVAQTQEAGLIAKALYDAGLNSIPRIGNSAFIQSSVIGQAGTEATEGWYSPAAFPSTVNEEPLASWNKRYVEKYGHAPEMTSVTTYDALSLLCKAVELAESSEPEKVNEQLRKLSGFEGIAAVYGYQGTPMLADSEFIVQIQKGQAVVLPKVVG